MTNRTCSVENCENPLRARGVCSSHYYRLQKHGDVQAHIPIYDRHAPKPTCAADECESAASRRGYCAKHYQRWMKYGDTSVDHPARLKGCAIDGCERQHYGRGWCYVHYTRWWNHGDPLFVSPHFSPFKGRRKEKNYAWVGDDAGYEAVHARLRDFEGPASDYTCSHCGGGAEHWAYDHEDEDEKISPAGLAYSTKGRRHYVPLCVPCHWQFDNQEVDGSIRAEDSHSPVA